MKNVPKIASFLSFSSSEILSSLINDVKEGQADERGAANIEVKIDST